MFLKTGELKKIMKSSLKRCGLIVGNVNGHYLVCSDSWGAYVAQMYATNKFKAAIMELIGDLPEQEECWFYTIGAEKEVQRERVLDVPNPYEDWKQAKDYAAATPLYLDAWPHEYVVFQKHSNREYCTAKRALTGAVISASELEAMGETMPGMPSILGNTLYFKNETTIWWVGMESAGSKVREVLFPRLSGVDFFEDDWGGGEEPLPY